MDAEQQKKVFYEHAGHIIRGRRKEAHLSGEAFGEYIDITKGMVSGYENGTTQIPGHMLYRISKVLGFEFAEYDPEIPKASDILQKIAEFKKTKAEPIKIGFTQSPGISLRNGDSKTVRVIFDETDKQFLDEYFNNTVPAKRKILDALNEMRLNNTYWDEMNGKDKRIFESMLKYIFQEKKSDDGDILERIYQKHFNKQ